MIEIKIKNKNDTKELNNTVTKCKCGKTIDIRFKRCFICEREYQKSQTKLNRYIEK